MQQLKDRDEQAGEAVARVSDLAGAVGDLVDEALKHDVDVQAGNEGQRKLDDGVGDGDEEAEAGVEFDADDGEDF